MKEWLLVITLTGQDVGVPIASYRLEAECRAVLKMWEFEPGKATGDCIPVIVRSVERNTRRRR